MAYQPTSLPAYQPTSLPAYQPYALKSGGDFARLTNNYTKRQPQALHERLRLAFLIISPLPIWA